MPKSGVAGNKLNLGSWFKSSSNATESKRQSRNSSAMAAMVGKDADVETTRKENVARTDGVPTTETTPNEVAKSEGVKPSTASMVELAAIITKETEKLEKYLKESGTAMPSFDVDAPANFPKLPEEMKKAREEIVRASKELTDLATGPTESIRWMAWDVSF